MKILTTKNKIVFLSGLIILLALSLFASEIFQKEKSFVESKIVLADDNDEDEEDDDKDDDNKKVYETIVETSYVQVSANVKKEITKTTLFDSDRDGIFDEEDEHPAINNFFIAIDQNKNGIVDKYEQ